MFFALLPAAAAAGLAWLMSRNDQAEFSFEWRCGWSQVGPAGQYLVFEVTLVDSPARPGDLVVVQPQIGGAFVRSRHPGFADEDGHIIGGAAIEMVDGKPKATVFIPVAAFPQPDGKLEMKMALVRDGKPLGMVAFEVEVAASSCSRRNNLAAICDAAIGAIRRDRTVERNDIAVARRLLVEAFEFDEFGTDMLRRRLKEAVSTPPQDGWFDPHRIAADIRDDTPAESIERVMYIIVQVAAANGTLGKEARDYLRLVAGALGLSVAQYNALIEAYGGIDQLLATLGLRADADRAAVIQAYRRLAKTCHPDMQAGRSAAESDAATERFRRITDAYDQLMARMAAV